MEGVEGRGTEGRGGRGKVGGRDDRSGGTEIEEGTMEREVGRCVGVQD